MINPQDYAKSSLKEKADFVKSQLKKDYPEVSSPLKHNSAFELLIATMLSPQTLDSTTNKVTPALFENYPDAYTLANANIDELEPMLRLVNYYKTKAKNLIKTAKVLIEKYDGRIPKTMAELLELPGVGRKIANVVVSEWYQRNEGLDPEGFVVDTHVIRVSNLLKLTSSKDPAKIEKDLMKIFPKEEWNDISLRFIFHGREFAQAKKPLYDKHPIWKEVYTSLKYI